MKKYIAILAALFLGLQLHAETVSQKQAQQLAHLFFNEAAGKVTPPPKLIYNGRKLTTNRLFTPYYVYNSSMGGFVIISAENKAFPILGFSLKGNFDPDRLGDTETALLRSYAREIELVRYNTEPIDRTIRSWQQYPEYVSEILKSRYVATDPLISIEETTRIVDDAVERNNAVYSDIYTPEQWRDMIDAELAERQSVPVAIIDNYQLLPVVVYGRQGEYFRLEMTVRNDWLMRLNATETIPSNMVAVVGNPPLFPEEWEEELPFESHDMFLAEVYEIEEERKSKPSIGINIEDGTPILKANGGGHYEIVFPEEIKEGRVYNLSGALVRKFQYKGSNVSYIDLSAEPYGFYIINVEGVSGTPYGFKLYR